MFFFFSSRRRHTRLQGDWSSDVCSSDLGARADRNRLRVLGQGAARGRGDLRAGAKGSRLPGVRQRPLFRAIRRRRLPLPETPEARLPDLAQALMADLKRQLGLLDSTMINVGTMIASAIFLVPSAIALQLHASSLTILVWVVGGVVSLLGALSVSELGAAMPKSGGQYAYLTEAYGPVWGYLFGWTSGVVINPASIAAIAVAFATYLALFVPLGVWGIKLIAVASIVALTVLNCVGVKPGTITQNVLTLLKIGLVAFLIVVGFALPGGAPQNFQPVWPESVAGSLIGPFGVAMVAALWAYDGWIEVCYVGGEVKDPGRNPPPPPLPPTPIPLPLVCLLPPSPPPALPPPRVAP